MAALADFAEGWQIGGMKAGGDRELRWLSKVLPSRSGRQTHSVAVTASDRFCESYLLIDQRTVFTFPSAVIERPSVLIYLVSSPLAKSIATSTLTARWCKYHYRLDTRLIKRLVLSLVADLSLINPRPTGVFPITRLTRRGAHSLPPTFETTGWFHNSNGIWYLCQICRAKADFVDQEAIDDVTGQVKCKMSTFATSSQFGGSGWRWRPLHKS